MAKIIDINENVISIGMDNGSIEEVRASDINFVPHIGDEVEVFKTETRVIVSKIEKKQEAAASQGININLSNTQGNGAVPGQVVIASGAKAVNKVTYCLLTLFLGGIGVHKFYAGKTGTGIWFAVFCWTGIPAVIALFDLIGGLTKPADANGMILI